MLKVYKASIDRTTYEGCECEFEVFFETRPLALEALAEAKASFDVEWDCTPDGDFAEEADGSSLDAYISEVAVYASHKEREERRNEILGTLPRLLSMN